MNTESLLEQFKNFEKNYHQKEIVVTSNFKKIPVLRILFDNSNFPHLIGLHKIYSTRPTELISKIENEKITLEHLKSNRQYTDMKDRVLNIHRLNHFFYSPKSEYFIFLNEVDKRNQMNLEIVFFEKDLDKFYTLGIRPRKDGKYSPVTFFVRKGKQLYPNSPRVKIHKIEII